MVRVEDELKAKDEEIAELKDKFEKEEKLRKDYEEKNVTLLSEKNDLMLQLQAVSFKIYFKGGFKQYPFFVRFCPFSYVFAFP